MAEVTLYSRNDCHLCDVAEKVLVEALLNRKLSYRKVDVDSNEELRSRFGDDVPVLEIDAEVAFKHRINLQALIDRLDNRSKRSDS